MNDLPPTPLTAPWWQSILYRIFGTRTVMVDDAYRVTMYEWRGILFIDSVDRIAPPKDERIRNSLS